MSTSFRMTGKVIISYIFVIKAIISIIMNIKSIEYESYIKLRKARLSHSKIQLLDYKSCPENGQNKNTNNFKATVCYNSISKEKETKQIAEKNKQKK